MSSAERKPQDQRMFRFTIRELLLLTLVVALGVGWALDHWRMSGSERDAALWREVALGHEQRVIRLEREQDATTSASRPANDSSLQDRLEEALRDLPRNQP